MSRTRALFASGSSVFHRASRWLHPACVLCVVAGLSFGAPVPAQSPSSAKIVVRVDSVGVTHVEQRYRLANDSGPARFRVLQRPCSRIGPVNVTVADAPRTLAPLPHGPWLEYVDSSDAARTAEREVSLAYDVNLTGREGEAEGDIPLVHLSRPLAKDDRAREGAVEVTVRFASGGGRVDFPHMARIEENEWSARFVAVPAFVHVRGLHASGVPCAPPDRAPNDGGLAWRFWLLAAIMVTWVPAYLLWARRSEGRES